MSSTLIIDFRQKNEPIFRDEFILIGNLHDKLNIYNITNTVK